MTVRGQLEDIQRAARRKLQDSKRTVRGQLGDSQRTAVGLLEDSQSTVRGQLENRFRTVRGHLQNNLMAVRGQLEDGLPGYSYIPAEGQNHDTHRYHRMTLCQGRRKSPTQTFSFSYFLFSCTRAQRVVSYRQR